MLAGLRTALSAPVDPAGLIVFRVGFGLLAAFSALRVMALGWVDALYVTPTAHLPWIPGLPTPSATVLYGLFVTQALAGLGLAWGRAPRAFLGAWLLSFGYVELLDKSLYLNHYVLFTLLGLWMMVIPLERLRLSGGALPAWGLVLLRVQVMTVYLWAGLAKLNSDWLVRGEPLTTWLEARAQLPLVGPFLANDWTALGMSWAGAAYDLSVPWLLLHPRTRPLGVVLVVGFHSAVGLIFPIGVFPALMILSSTLLWSPSWPRRWLGAWTPPPASAPPPWPWPRTAVLIAVILAMVIFPGRGFLRGEDVAWTERGHRLAWRVMLVEKTGLVEYRVVEAKTGRVWRVTPSEGLTTLQHKQLRTQPDLIRDYALQLKAQQAAAGRDVAVFAESWVSLNGRPSQRLLRDDLDLTQPLGVLDDAGWILPRQGP